MPALCTKRMNLFIVADIFGRTKALDTLASYIIGKNINVEIIDPYNNRYRNFKTEDTAYSTFQKEIGLDQYAEFLIQKVKSRNTGNNVILGFSVGASALWVASPQLEVNHFKGIGFYSSQIAQYLDIKTNIDIKLFFAKSEQSYKVETVFTYLKNFKNVKCIQTEYLHGFMNQLSKNFNEIGYYKYLKIINNCITSHSTGLAEARR